MPPILELHFSYISIVERARVPATHWGRDELRESQLTQWQCCVCREPLIGSSPCLSLTVTSQLSESSSISEDAQNPDSL